jgi:hypothetical protein
MILVRTDHPCLRVGHHTRAETLATAATPSPFLLPSPPPEWNADTTRVPAGTAAVGRAPLRDGWRWGKLLLWWAEVTSLGAVRWSLEEVCAAARSKVGGLAKRRRRGFLGGGEPGAGVAP